MISIFFQLRIFHIFRICIWNCNRRSEENHSQWGRPWSLSYASQNVITPILTKIMIRSSDHKLENNGNVSWLKELYCTHQACSLRPQFQEELLETISPLTIIPVTPQCSKGNLVKFLMFMVISAIKAIGLMRVTYLSFIFIILFVI